MKRIAIIVLLLLPCLLKAQWQTLHNTGSAVLALYFLDNEGHHEIGFVSYADRYDINHFRPRGIKRTTDGGKTWNRVVMDDSLRGGISFTFKDSLIGWYACPNLFTDQIIVWKTTDGGQSWFGLSNTKGLIPGWSIYYNKRTRVLFSLPDMCSTDEGASWHPNTGCTGDNISFYKDSIGFTTPYPGGGFALAGATTDSGNSWNCRVPNVGAIVPLAAKTAQGFSFFMAGSRGNIVRSTDKGVSWDTVFQFMPANSRQFNGQIDGSAHCLYVQDDKGFYASTDEGFTWKSICGPGNSWDNFFYCHNDTIYAGDTSGNIWVNPHADRITSRANLDDIPKKLSLFPSGCASFDTTLIIRNLNTCFALTLDSISLSGSNKFKLTSQQSLPALLSDHDSLVLSYSADYNSLDTAILTLHFTGDEGSFDTTITIIGTQDNNQKRLPLINYKVFPTISSCEDVHRILSIKNLVCWPLALDSVRITGDTSVIQAGNYSSLPFSFSKDEVDSLDLHFNPHFKYGNFQIRMHVFGRIIRNGVEDKYDTIITITAKAKAEGPKLVASAYTIDLDSIGLCARYKDTTITLSNRGCDTLRITQGPGAFPPEFQLLSSFTLPVVLSPDSSIALKIRFTPSSASTFKLFPFFKTTQQGIESKTDLIIQGSGIEEGAKLEYYPTEFSFAPLSICSKDSASGYIANIGCDKLLLDNASLSGDQDFISALSLKQITLFPDDTIRYKVYVNPVSKGRRTGKIILSSNNGLVLDTIPVAITITDGTRILTLSERTVDFGSLPICAERDTTFTLRNTGCDTISIYNFESTGTGFSVTDTSFILLPGQAKTITIHTVVDTTNGKTINTGGVVIGSDADIPINGISLSRNFSYPKDYSVRFAVNKSSGKNQDQVTMQIIADSLPQGLTQLSANLTIGNTDLLSFVDYASPNAVTLNGNNITITGTPIKTNGNILAELHYKVFLTKDSTTSINFSNVSFNNADPDYSNCVARVQGAGSGGYDYQFVCGEHTVAKLLRGDELRISSINPNPTQGEITITIESPTKTDGVIDVYDILGKKIVTESKQLSKGKNSILLDTKSIARGRYSVRLKANDSEVQSAFVKE